MLQHSNAHRTSTVIYIGSAFLVATLNQIYAQQLMRAAWHFKILLANSENQDLEQIETKIEDANKKITWINVLWLLLNLTITIGQFILLDQILEHFYYASLTSFFEEFVLFIPVFTYTLVLLVKGI
jgi:hypothetical protein